MKSRKRTPTNAATSAGEELGAETGQAATSTNDFTTSGVPGQRISALLGTGAAQGLTISDLERLTGWRSREIRKQIELERRAGALILSDNRNGYFMATDPAEAERFARSMRHRAREILRTAAAIKGAAGTGGDSI